MLRKLSHTSWKPCVRKTWVQYFKGYCAVRLAFSVGGSTPVVLFLRRDELLPRGGQASRRPSALGAPGEGAIPAQEPEVIAASDALSDLRLLSHRWERNSTAGFADLLCSSCIASVWFLALTERGA